MKRVLFIAYLFPPIANSGTQRPLKFAKFLTEHGWEPTVITADRFDGHNTDPGLLDEIPGVRVVRVPMLNERVGDVISTALCGTALGKRIADGVSWRMQQRRRSPDLFALWQPTAVRAALRIFRETGFDAIYATGFPWTSLMIGREIAKATGVPLVADFRDLWAGEPLFTEGRPSHEEELALEQQLLESATSVVSASETMSRSLSNMHPSVDADKFMTIHNGFDPVDLDVAPAAKEPGRFRIVYTGVWKDGYNPGELYHTIDWLKRSHPEVLENVEVVAAGFKPGEARRRGLTKYITEVGVLPHEQAVALIRSGDLLYLSHVSPDRQWAVPGKLYEYLASGAPVMALTDPNGETARIIDKVGGAVAIAPEDPGNLYYALLHACRMKSVAMPPRRAEALQAFERRHLAGKLAEILTEVSSRTAVRIEPRVAYAAPGLPRLRTR
jgi:hypothetical protein